MNDVKMSIKERQEILKEIEEYLDDYFRAVAIEKVCVADRCIMESNFQDSMKVHSQRLKNAWYFSLGDSIDYLVATLNDIDWSLDFEIEDNPSWNNAQFIKSFRKQWWRIREYRKVLKQRFKTPIYG